MANGRIIAGLMIMWLVLWACGFRSPQPVEEWSEADMAGRAERLRQAIRSWEGTPHRLGGNDRGGIDCSGLVVRIYRDLFNWHLPRTTKALMATGRSVAADTLAPGDLVFFRLPDGKRHVGIYIERGQFAHASTRRGVMFSRLTEPYWQESYWTARRLLA